MKPDVYDPQTDTVNHTKLSYNFYRIYCESKGCPCPEYEEYLKYRSILDDVDMVELMASEAIMSLTDSVSEV